MSDPLELRSITKRFGGLEAVRDLSFAIKTNEIVGLVGQNGSGKTTVFNIISGYIRPDSGQVLYRGKDVTRLAPHQRANMGFGRLFQDVRIFGELSVMDNMLLAQSGPPEEKVFVPFLKSRMLKAAAEEHIAQARHWLGFIALDARGRDLAGGLSYGQQKLLAVAMILSRNPDLLLLDEPAAGLDLKMRHKLSSLVERLKGVGKTVLCIEHSLDFLLGVSDRVVMLRSGAKIYEGGPDAIRSEAANLKRFFFNNGVESYAEWPKPA